MDNNALVDLLHLLKASEYRFTAVTPATHVRVLKRVLEHPPTLRDVFGWNRPFHRDALPADVFGLMDRAGIIEQDNGRLRSRLRVASLGTDLFLHSAFPTDTADAVFFGPDTYRFVSFVEREIASGSPMQIVDMGAGGGAGGIAAARLVPDATVTLVDTNPAALTLAEVNARAAGVTVGLLHDDEIPAGADLVIANPPYMMDSDARAYRHGGDLLGGQVSLDWVRDALGKLTPGGTMLLYTGAAIVGGESPLQVEIAKACAQAAAFFDWTELDPDVFGEELDQPAYQGVERIAAVGVVIRTAV